MNHNDEQAWDWDDAYTGQASDFNLSPPDSLLLETVLSLSPGCALDVGCGAGALLGELARAGWDVTGLDIAPKGVAAARSAFRERGIKAEVHLADATKWMPKKEYDLITNAFALPIHREERAAVFKMVGAATRPGGHFVLKEFDGGMDRIGSPFQGMDLVTLDELREAFDGWRIERAEIVETPNHSTDSESPEGLPWSGVFFVAQKLASAEK